MLGQSVDAARQGRQDLDESLDEQQYRRLVHR
jgi:hypothetical protein